MQDWRNHRIGSDEPTPHVEVYDTQEQAMTAKAKAKANPEQDILMAVVSIDRLVAKAARLKADRANQTAQ